MPRRTKNLQLKFISTGTTPENHAIIRQAAKLEGQSLGDFMAVAVIAAAKSVLAAQPVGVLSSPTATKPLPARQPDGFLEAQAPDKVDKLVQAIEKFLRSPEGS